jgi:LysM repeat protein
VGDTAESIANKFGVYLEALKLAHPQIDNFGNLRVGTVLNIPLPGFRPQSTSPNPSQAIESDPGQLAARRPPPAARRRPK